MIGHALDPISKRTGRLVTMCKSLDGKRRPSKSEIRTNFIATFDEDITCRACIAELARRANDTEHEAAKLAGEGT